MKGALDGLKVLDLTRILAGPTCTQLLGDMGANIIKIENPITGGDDTRSWGPPFAKSKDGSNTDLSAYFMSANRNKKSVSVDLKEKEGQELVKKLAQKCDIIIENFKPGSLKPFGLDYESVSKINPNVIFCAISGFGQSGPNSHKPGYDLMAQGYGGIMSLTGESNGLPVKVGVGVADVMCGMYATTGILAALNHRNKTGEGQYIDIALVDSQIAWLINEGVNYLTSGQLPVRRGNQHPNIVPYQVYEVKDGYLIIAVGNDSQFARFAKFIDLEELIANPKFTTNPARLKNREELNSVLIPQLKKFHKEEIIEGLEALKVPVGPVNQLDEVFTSDQVRAREMLISLPATNVENGILKMIGNPLKFSKTPVSYRYAPPRFGEHTDAVKNQLFGDEL